MPPKQRDTKLIPGKGEHRSAFTRVYACREWGGGSGPGSRLRSTRLYRQVLERILVSCHVRRVVDLGCGDWQFSRRINWSGINYLGVDVVPEVIESNFSRHSRKNIQFKCADFRHDSILDADLYILKDVLQHWPTREIQSFLRKMAGKQMLITNTVWAGTLPINGDIYAGDYRPLDLLATPFRLRNARTVLEYFATELDYKRVLLVNGPPSV